MHEAIRNSLETAKSYYYHVLNHCIAICILSVSIYLPFWHFVLTRSLVPGQQTHVTTGHFAVFFTVVGALGFRHEGVVVSLATAEIELLALTTILVIAPSKGKKPKLCLPF